MDRALVVPTVAETETAFFEDGGMMPFANLPVPVLKDLAEALDEGRLTTSLEAKTIGALVSSEMGL